MSEEEKKFLEIVDLKKGFGSGQTRQEVLRRHEFFRCQKGEFCVLFWQDPVPVKSALLNIIGGIDNADSGYININGDKLEDMSEKKLTQYRKIQACVLLAYGYSLEMQCPDLWEDLKDNVGFGFGDLPKACDRERNKATLKLDI